MRGATTKSMARIDQVDATIDRGVGTWRMARCRRDPDSFRHGLAGTQPPQSPFNLHGTLMPTDDEAELMVAGKYHGAVLLLLLQLTASGCGYRLAGGAIDTGAGQTLAVPIFNNLTTDFRIEQHLTAAVRRELVQRTGYRVLSATSGDVVLTGQVLRVNSIPVILTDRGRGTAYSVTVDVGVRLTDSSDGSVVYENPRWTSGRCSSCRTTRRHSFRRIRRPCSVFPADSPSPSLPLCSTRGHEVF